MNAEAIMKQLGIDKEHKGKIEEVSKYIDEHRIQELFNVSASLITKIAIIFSFILFHNE